jgi:DNA-binding MarR family transcriptional regulator
MGQHDRPPTWARNRFDWIESAYRRLGERGDLNKVPRAGTARLLHDIHRAHHVIGGSHAEFLKPYNLTEAKFRLLMWLLMADSLDHPDGVLPSELSEFQGISRNTVSALLKSLNAQGLIERKHHPDDRRQVIITITDHGRALMEKIGSEYLAFVDSTLDTLTEDERRQLSCLLEKLIIVQRTLQAQALNASDPPTSDLADAPTIISDTLDADR